MSETDIFRDTWIRYLGYSNELGESFRSVVPLSVVKASYAVAFSYVLADTADKSIKMSKKTTSPKRIAVTAGDALLWQTFASVVIPGYTINRLCAFSEHVLKVLKWPKSVSKWITVGVGLASIPIIIHPIDSVVTIGMNLTYRRWANTFNYDDD